MKCVLQYVLLLSLALVVPISMGTRVMAADEGTVSGAGTVTIKRQPEMMRMQVHLFAQGTSLKSALKLLKERIKTARSEVLALKADADSVKVASPMISTEKSDQQKQLEQMIASQLRQGRGKKKKRKPLKPPVKVSAQLTAEWTLKTKVPEELLLASHDLQTRINKVEFSAGDEVEKLTPEQQEIMEEFADNGFGGYSSGEEADPGKPVFVFVSRISDADQDKAVAEAFQKAKHKATRLAQAAGLELGELKNLASQKSNDNDFSEYGGLGGFDPYNYPFMQSYQQNDETDDDNPEAIGPAAKPLTYNINVTASFTLKAKK